MIAIVVCDGLRPDLITPQLTPFIYGKAREGSTCKNSHAVFPSSTRVNAASLITGCYPGRHGIVDNSFYVPSLNPSKVLPGSDPKVLQAVAGDTGGQLLDVPTLGKLLSDSGMTLACASAGSPGTMHILSTSSSGPVIHWSSARPLKVSEEITHRYGGFPSSGSAYEERNRFILEVVENYLVPELRPDVLLMWLNEPDHTQHSHGIASPEARAVMADIDGKLCRFWGKLEGIVGRHDLTCLFGSDHGFSTINSGGNPGDTLISAGLKRSTDSEDIIVGPQSIYLSGGTKHGIDEIVKCLIAEPWLGGLFLKEDQSVLPFDAASQRSVWGGHLRSAPIMYANRWTSQTNPFGVPGCVNHRHEKPATHGSASPYDIHNCLMAWGQRIKPEFVSSLPCGIVDIAPTVLHLLGRKPDGEMQGRVLEELLTDFDFPADDCVTEKKLVASFDSLFGPRRQIVSYSDFGLYRYLDQVELIREESHQVNRASTNNIQRTAQHLYNGRIQKDRLISGWLMIREAKMLNEHTFDSGVVAVNYAEGPSSGDPLVFLHGLSQRWQYFLPILPNLAERWHVYALDARGHGRSGRVTGGYHVSSYAQDPAAFLQKELAQPAVLYGHSLGAMVSVCVADEYPERVRALVLEDPPLFASMRVKGPEWYKRLDPVRTLARSEFSLEEMMSALAKRRPDESPDYYRNRAEDLVHLDPDVLTASMERRTFEGFDIEAVLKRISRPVLLLQGDPLLGAVLADQDIEQAVSLLPDCSHVQIVGVGHGITSTKPAEVLRAVTRFLDSLAAPDRFRPLSIPKAGLPSDA